MNNRRYPAVLVILLALTIIISVIAAAAGTRAAPVACAGTKAPQAAVTGFFDALCAGDMQLADSYVSDYSGLGFDGPAEGFEAQFYNKLISSYSYSLQGDLRSQPGRRCYVQTVAFRHIDIARSTENISDTYELALRNASTEFPTDQIYNEDGTYNQELVELAMKKTVQYIFADAEQYSVTENIDVEVEYSGGKWQVVVSPRLADAILGQSDSASSGTESAPVSGTDGPASGTDSPVTETEVDQQ